MSVGQGYDGEMRPFCQVKKLTPTTMILPTNVATFPTAQINPYGMWDVTRNNFICQIPGTYRVEINAADIDSSLGPEGITFGILKNNVLVDTIPGLWDAQSSGFHGDLSGSRYVPMKANDILTFVWTDTATAVVIGAGATLMISFADVYTS